MISNKARWIYFMMIMDLELAEILLHSCKYIIFDPQETILEVKRLKLQKEPQNFMINKLLNEQLVEIIKEKKNRHIIYVCRKTNPLEIIEWIEPLIKELSPTSKFYFNLISNKKEHLKLHQPGGDMKLKKFYAIYIQ